MLICVHFDTQTLSVTANGETHTATVEDKCMGCSSGDLGTFSSFLRYSSFNLLTFPLCRPVDMSPTLFQTFADEAVGVVEVSWYYTS